MTHSPLRLPAVLAPAAGLAPPAQAAAEPAARQEGAPDDLTLWYDRPATDWETQALPIGNGPLGAKIFGGVATEQLQFNEKTLWTGGPGSPGYDFGNGKTPRPDAIAEVQRQIDRDGTMAPDAVAAKLGRPKTGFGAYQTFGDLYLDFAGAPLNPTAYRRELSLRDAVARVTYAADGVTTCCPPTCRACGTTPPARPGRPTTTSTSTCR
ncbi:glycoside hydrolase N-terminal domain-containing protein [Microbispora catharanthi]|uniref:glycoside hydrolase N-terminal domain-containing protein n=1 Tax=Microbispora catharanthi TaxID=1712871 RepID=UPI001F0FBAF6|nr:glycoside hydrolase N-terminal domain-containing protein [Microbispora catharanthi]